MCLGQRLLSYRPFSPRADSQPLPGATDKVAELLPEPPSVKLIQFHPVR